MEDTNDLLKEVQASMGRMQKEHPAYMAPFGMFMKKQRRWGTYGKDQGAYICCAFCFLWMQWCIAFHVKGALDAGASREEIIEACYVAVLMGGGPSMMQMGRVMKALDDYGSKVIP